MKRWKRLATVALVPVVALAGLGVAAVVADQSGLAGAAGRASAVSATSSLDHYVALGDSYAAGYGNGGPGISFLDQTGANETSPDDNCGRTPSAHPVQLNNWFKSFKNIGSLTFSFLACTGATTSNVDANSPARANGLDGEKNLSTVLGPTYGLGDNGEGYQLGNGSTPNATYKSELQNAKVVTLSAGGNDIYFSDVIATCVAGGFALVARVNVACSSLSPTSSRVRDLYSNITALGTVLQQVYADVRDAAPSAQIYVMGYPDIVPPQPSTVQQTLGCGGIGGIGAISYLAGAENSLNQVIKDQAASAGFHFVDPNIGSNPFSNHSICAKKTWFNLQFHPNAQGQSALFKDFQREIKNVAKNGTLSVSAPGTSWADPSQGTSGEAVLTYGNAGCTAVSNGQCSGGVWPVGSPGQWIWKSQNVSPTEATSGDGPVNFTTSFFVPAGAAATVNARVTYAADNLLNVIVNGQEVISGATWSDPGNEALQSTPISLTTGKMNTVVFSVTNSPGTNPFNNPAGVTWFITRSS